MQKKGGFNCWVFFLFYHQIKSKKWGKVQSFLTQLRKNL